MQNLTFPIEIRPSPLHGYGVFATRLIRKGEVIEECPTLVLNQSCDDLSNYVFHWGENKENDKQSALPLGYGCLYNHSAIPNATWKCNTDKQKITFIARQDILKGQEILVYYREKWFEERGIRALETKEAETKIARKKLLKSIPRIIIVVFAFLLIKAALAQHTLS